MSTAAQIAANLKNAQLSTGPSSQSGKAKSSLNAVKSGLTGHTVLLPSEDAALYQAHVSEFVQHYAPVGDEECKLVQSLADTEWRLLRIPALEMGIYAVGRLEFAGLFPDEDEAVRKHLIEAQVFLAYQRVNGARNSKDVTTPKFPPPPRKAQKRFSCSDALAVRTPFSAVTT